MEISDLIDTFELLGDWQARYDYISELGKKLGPFPETGKTDANLVHGCLTRVWVTGRLNDETPPRMDFQAEAEGPLIRGLVALLVLLHRDKTPEEVLAVDAEHLIARLGLDENLSPNRHVGMYAMVEKIKGIARGQRARSGAA